MSSRACGGPTSTGIVTIAQQFTGGAFSELKTDNARRRIPLPLEVLKDLKLWKLRTAHTEQGLVFPSPAHRSMR